MKEILIQLCSWNNPNILKSCVESIKKSLDTDSDIVVSLNEGDKESIEYLQDNKIHFWYSPYNWGTLAVDFSLPLSLKYQKVIYSNDDMLFHRGWDKDLLNIINENYPCSASCGLVEKIDTNNPIVRVDNLGEFTEEDTYRKFIENVNLGKYIRQKRMISYSHPIMVKTSDYLNVGGYSNNLDMEFWPGWAADDMYPYRLWKLHNENFKFITSEKSVVYHGMSLTNNKLEKRQHNNGWDSFIRKTGMNIHQFRQKINCFSLIE